MGPQSPDEALEAKGQREMACLRGSEVRSSHTHTAPSPGSVGPSHHSLGTRSVARSWGGYFPCRSVGTWEH